MSNNSGSSSGGIGFIGLLQVLFIALKLLGVIDWNWFFVLLPLIIELVIFLVLIIIVVFFDKDK